MGKRKRDREEGESERDRKKQGTEIERKKERETHPPFLVIGDPSGLAGCLGVRYLAAVLARATPPSFCSSP
jgi:hypothetical protein